MESGTWWMMQPQAVACGQCCSESQQTEDSVDTREQIDHTSALSHQCKRYEFGTQLYLSLFCRLSVTVRTADGKCSTEGAAPSMYTCGSQLHSGRARSFVYTAAHTPPRTDSSANSAPSRQRITPKNQPELSMSSACHCLRHTVRHC